MSMRTHYDTIKEISNEGWNFNQRFVRKLVLSRREYHDTTVLHALAGKEPKPTGKWLCTLCDGYLSESECSQFEGWVRGQLKRNIIDPYIEKHCPKCEEKMEEIRPIHIIEDDWVNFGDIIEMEDLPVNPQCSVKVKMQYHPCECRVERGEEKILWDLNKEKAEEEFRLLNYNGSIFQTLE